METHWSDKNVVYDPKEKKNEALENKQATNLCTTKTHTNLSFDKSSQPDRKTVFHVQW